MKRVSKRKKKPIHIRHRDTVLTFLMKNSLGGNAKTVMIAAISPSSYNVAETITTLRFAQKCKKIRNVVAVNEDPNKVLIMQMKAEIERLRLALQEKDEPSPSKPQANNDVVDLLAEQKEVLRSAMEQEFSKRLEEEKMAIKNKVRKEEERVQIEKAKKEERALQEEFAKRLEQERQEWKERAKKEEERVKLEREREEERLRLIPHLVNLNEDPLLSGKLTYFLEDGNTHIGRRANTHGADNCIKIGGADIQPEHSTIAVTSDAGGKKSVQVIAKSNALVFVNGNKLGNAEGGDAPSCNLTDGDRVIFGNSTVFIIRVPSAQMSHDQNDGSDDDYGDDFEMMDWEDAMKEKNEKLVGLLFASDEGGSGGELGEAVSGGANSEEALLQNEKIDALEAAIRGIREELQSAKNKRNIIMSDRLSTPEHIQGINTTIRQLQQEKGNLVSESLSAYREMLAQTGLSNCMLVDRLSELEKQVGSIYDKLKTKEEQKDILSLPEFSQEHGRSDGDQSVNDLAQLNSEIRQLETLRNDIEKSIEEIKRETVKTVKSHHDAKRDLKFLLYRTIPLKDEANSISHILKKGVVFHLTIQTVDAMKGIVCDKGSEDAYGEGEEGNESDERGWEDPSKIMMVVAVSWKDKKKPNAFWTLQKFQDRLILMREMFNAWEQTQHKDEFDIDDDVLWKMGYNLGNDPFYDPPESRKIGSAPFFLEPVYNLRQIDPLQVTLIDFVENMSHSGLLTVDLQVFIVDEYGDRLGDRFVEAMYTLDDMLASGRKLYMNLKVHLSACQIGKGIVYPFEDKLSAKFQWFGETKWRTFQDNNSTILEGNNTVSMSLDEHIDMQPITPELAAFLKEGNLIFDVWVGCSNPSSEMERDLEKYNAWQQSLESGGRGRLVDMLDSGPFSSTLQDPTFSLSSSIPHPEDTSDPAKRIREMAREIEHWKEKERLWLDREEVMKREIEAFKQKELQWLAHKETLEAMLKDAGISSRNSKIRSRLDDAMSFSIKDLPPL